METRNPTWRHLVAPVGFALMCFLLAMATWRLFDGSTPLEPRAFRLTVPLPKGDNLYPGADVRTAGVTIGKVVRVRRTGSRASATLEIEPDHAPVRSGARVVLRLKTLLGEGYVEMAPGPPGASLLPEGGTLAAANVYDAQRLDDVVSTFEPATRRDLRRLFAGMAETFGDRSADLNAAVSDLAPATANFAEMLRILDAGDRDLRTAISSSADVFRALGGRAGTLQAAVTAGEDALAITADRDRELRATVRAMPPFLRSLRGASSHLGAMSTDLDPAVAGLEPSARNLEPFLAAIEGAAAEFRPLLRRTPGLLRAGNRGLPSVRPILEETRTAFEPIWLAARHLIPLMSLLSDNRDVVSGSFANAANMMNTKFLGPGGEELRGASGVVTFWNETLAGWRKRLPTHRSNPYPKPGALGELSRKGRLESYDCRHLGNQAYFPATGTGTPPCVTQGPWEFNGKSAYYPRLEVASP
jgi:virulence factor Mce-like protein